MKYWLKIKDWNKILWLLNEKTNANNFSNLKKKQIWEIYIYYGDSSLASIHLMLWRRCTYPHRRRHELRFKVPQGTNSWDDDISQIQKDFGVYLIYKDLQDEDFNRSWTGGASTNYKGEGCINDEMAKFYTEFMKKHVFSYLNNEKCKKVTSKLLPLYWYMAFIMCI